MIDETLEQPIQTAPRTLLAPPLDEALEPHIQKATQALLACQRPDGHWVFELEADATIPAEYVLLRHYLGEPVDAALEAKIAVYLRRIQGEHGGWPLFRDGDLDISATVKAYFALKMIGDSIDADHMRRAREALLARGGAARANVFTRIMLALFGFIPWRAVPVMPVEIMLLPKWFPFHLDKISYWSRTVIVPLLVLMAKKPQARNAKGVRIDELFLEPPQSIGPTPKAPQQKASWFWFFRGVDNVLRATEPFFPAARASAPSTRRRLGERAIERRGWARRDFPGHGQQRDDVRRARLSGESSAARHRAQIGREASGRARARGLLPALRLADLGYRAHLSRLAGSRRRARGRRGQARPRLARAEAGARRSRRLDRAAARYSPRRLGLPIRQPALSRRRRHRRRRHGHGSGARLVRPARTIDASLARAREWIVGMQSENGAWGAFDADNEYYYLNNIPFADHGALLDPPTEDVTARCLSMLAQFGETIASSAAVAAASIICAERSSPTAAGTAAGA